jgi:hypothetical protein
MEGLGLCGTAKGRDDERVRAGGGGHQGGFR